MPPGPCTLTPVLQVLLEPLHHLSVPERAVLRLQDPVALVRKDDELRRHALSLQRAVELEALRVGEPIVDLAAGDERRRLVLAELARVTIGRPLLVARAVAPRRALVLRFGEPELLGGVHRRDVVHAGVGDERLERTLPLRGESV